MKNTTPFIPALDTALKPPKLLDQLKRCIRDKQYSPRTEEACVCQQRFKTDTHRLVNWEGLS